MAQVSLFGDEGQEATSSIFADDDGWGRPTPGKAQRVESPTETYAAPPPTPPAFHRNTTSQSNIMPPDHWAPSNSVPTSPNEEANGRQSPAKSTYQSMNTLVDPFDGHIAQSSASFGTPTFEGGFDTQSRADQMPYQVTSSRTTGNGITVARMPEMAGSLAAKYWTYQLSNPRPRNTKVVRRYSDFDWLLKCLHKKYPFRRLPLLPPKHPASLQQFMSSSNLEQRRRGLARFANALDRHPVLSKEQLVVQFLTVPTDLSVWKDQAAKGLQDEFTGKSLTPGQEDAVPSSLNDVFKTSKSGLEESAVIYIRLCELVKRLAIKEQELAIEHGNLDSQLMSLSGHSHATYAIDPKDVNSLNKGIEATAFHAGRSKELMIDESRTLHHDVLEDLKTQRDALVSMIEMFQRHDRFEGEKEETIQRREKSIRKNEAKLAKLREKPAEMVSPGEIEKITESIIKDKEFIVQQHAKSVLAKECVRDELRYFVSTQHHVIGWNKDWAGERVKYSELQQNNWEDLHKKLDNVTMSEE